MSHWHLIVQRTVSKAEEAEAKAAAEEAKAAAEEEEGAAEEEEGANDDFASSGEIDETRIIKRSHFSNNFPWYHEILDKKLKKHTALDGMFLNCD